MSLIYNVDSKEQPYRPRRVIQFDVDGVLADFGASFTLEMHLLFGTPIITADTQQEWDYSNCGVGITKENESAAWKVVKSTPLWWFRLRPLVNEETFHRINGLQTRHEVVFVTNRMSNCEPPGWQTKLWLKKHGVELPSVVATKKKGLQAEVLGADYSLEDKIENCWAIHWISDRPQTRSYLLNRPYNQLGGRRIGPRVPRVDTVDEFLDIIEKETHQ